MRTAMLMVAIPVFVAGCASSNASLRNSPAFREGYEDGCAAATNAGADLRGRAGGDRQLYQSNEAYRAGYGNGLALCRRSDLDSAMTPQNGPIGLPGPGH